MPLHLMFYKPEEEVSGDLQKEKDNMVLHNEVTLNSKFDKTNLGLYSGGLSSSGNVRGCGS